MAKRILIVDDDVDFTDLIRSKLEETGKYEVRVENQGSRGIRAASLFKPDLILLDIVMPDIDGSEVAEKIRDDKNIKNTPIVFLTSIVSKEEVRSGGGFIGGQYFIAKPASAREILNSIDRILEK